MTKGGIDVFGQTTDFSGKPALSGKAPTG